MEEWCHWLKNFSEQGKKNQTTFCSAYFEFYSSPAGARRAGGSWGPWSGWTWQCWVYDQIWWSEGSFPNSTIPSESVASPTETCAVRKKNLSPEGLSTSGGDDLRELHPFFVWESTAGAEKLSVRESSCYSLSLPEFISDGENHRNSQGKVIFLLKVFFNKTKKENWNGMIPLMALWVVWGCLHACWVLLGVFKEPKKAVLVCYYHFLQSRGSSELSLALPGRNDLLDDLPELPAFAFPSSIPCTRMETLHGLHLNRDSPTPKQDLYPKILINCKS